MTEPPNQTDQTLAHFITLLCDELQEREEGLITDSLNQSPVNPHFTIIYAQMQAERRLLESIQIRIPQIVEEMMNPQHKE